MQRWNKEQNEVKLPLDLKGKVNVTLWQYAPGCFFKFYFYNERLCATRRRWQNKRLHNLLLSFVRLKGKHHCYLHCRIILGSKLCLLFFFLNVIRHFVQQNFISRTEIYQYYCIKSSSFNGTNHM